MNNSIIENSVYFLKINKIKEYIKQETKFVSLFSDADKNKLIEIYYRSNKNKNIFNGISVRLDKATLDDQEATLEISKINYFDLIVSNILCFNLKRWLDNCLNEEEIYFCNNKINEIKDKVKIHKKFEDIINNEYISNIMAVSVLIEDKNGKIGITKRSSSLNISSGLVSTTATGSVDGEDFNANDPLTNCVKKEVLEELGIKVEEIELKGISISKTKLQPIVLFDARINESWEDIIDKIKMAKDYKNEVEDFLSISISDIPELLNNNELSDATRYHIYLKYIENVNN